MYFLIVQEAGRHPENARFRECLCLQRAFERAGHKSIVWGPGHPNYIISFDSLVDICDAVIVLENYEEGAWIPGLATVEKPKLFWSIDAHCAFDAHLEFARRHRIDLVLCAVLPAVERYQENGLHCEWLPNAFPADLIRPQSAKKIVDIGYCGSLGNPERQHYLKTLEQKIDLHADINVLGDAMVGAIGGYTIHFNYNLGNDVNYRTFETLGIGTFLLTNKTLGLEKLFNIDEHLVTYFSESDCLEKMWYYLGHQDERQRIADAGTAHVHQNHSYDNRAAAIVGLIKEEEPCNPL